MEIDLTVYRGEQESFFQEYEFSPVLRKAAALRFGDVARKGKIQLELQEPADATPYPGPPELRNLTDGLGYCRLRMIQDGKTVRDERLRVSDLLGPILVRELHALEPDETRWAFRLERRRRLAVIVTLGGEERPAPENAHTVEVTPREKRHRPFRVTRVTSPSAAAVEPATLGLDPAELGAVNVLMSAEIHEQFVREIPLSNRMEEGGFLLGRVTTAGDDVHLVEITHVTPAQQSGAGMTHFTFTGESFLAVPQLIAERGRGEELLGWYHTHLFGVDVGMGLSSVDVDLHLATFRRPWQVAALINLRRKHRVLRFYGRGEQELKEYRQWIADDSGRYRPADPAVGGD